MGKLTGVTTLAVLATLVFGGTALATQHHKKKLGKIVTATASSSASTSFAIMSATASCPKKTRAVGGGFFVGPTNVMFIPPTPTFAPAVYESQMVGNNAWRVSVQVPTNTSSTLFNMLASVHCRKGLPATTSVSTTVPTPAGVMVGPSATSSCPRKQKVISGGFATPPPYFPGGQSDLITDSAPLGGTGWQSRVVSQPVAGMLTNYAYCARFKKPLKPPLQSTNTLSSSINAADAFVRDSCPNKKAAGGGGFSQPNAQASPMGLFQYLNESQRVVFLTAGASVGTGWEVSALHEGTTTTSLVSTAMCG
jgi:hypothetical protein